MTTKVQEIQAKRPSTSGLSVRCDLRTLAELSLFWDSRGEPMPSMSMLIRVSLEVFRDTVLNKFNSPSVETHQEAIQVLEERGLRFHATRGRRNLSKALAEESTTLTEFVDALPEPKREQFTSTHPRVKQAQQSMDKVEVIAPDVELIEDAQKRRDEELEKGKSSMEDVIKRALK